MFEKKTYIKRKVIKKCDYKKCVTNLRRKTRKFNIWRERIPPQENKHRLIFSSVQPCYQFEEKNKYF